MTNESDVGGEHFLEDVFVLLENVKDEEIGVLDEIGRAWFVAGMSGTVFEDIGRSFIAKVFLEKT